MQQTLDLPLWHQNSGRNNMQHSYYFAVCMNRLSLFSSGKSRIEIDHLAFKHINEQSPNTILGIARVFMGGINDQDFGQNIKKIMAGGMIDRLKIEASNIVSSMKNSI